MLPRQRIGFGANAGPHEEEYQHKNRPEEIAHAQPPSPAGLTVPDDERPPRVDAGGNLDRDGVRTLNILDPGCLACPALSMK
jgi:hypothetical protein